MAYILQVLTKSYIMAGVEIKKLFRDPAELVSRAIQPILWLGIFGEAMARTKAIPTEGFTYLQFITPGILGQSVAFIAIFYGLSVIWERDMGLLQKIIVTPTPRLALIWSKMILAAVRGLSQALIVIIFALVLKVQLQLSLFSIFGVVIIIILGTSFFSGLSMIIAALVKTRERFMGIGQVITLPLFFASNAIYPIEIMPRWLQIVSNLNPLSYLVAGLLSFLITGNLERLPLDLGFLVIAVLVVSLISAYMYPKVAV